MGECESSLVQQWVAICEGDIDPLGQFLGFALAFALDLELW